MNLRQLMTRELVDYWFLDNSFRREAGFTYEQYLSLLTDVNFLGLYREMGRNIERFRGRITKDGYRVKRRE